MSDPRVIVELIQSGGEYNPHNEEQYMALRAAEYALGSSLESIVSHLSNHMNEAELEFLSFRRAQINNDAALAEKHLTNALNYSRNQSNRSHLLEARIRMEWGLLRYTLGEEVQAGVDLRWAVERIAALDEGHPWHGLALLNMATWHANRGESGMALAMHSEIRRDSPHSIEIIAISRRSAAELFIQKQHHFTALRNLWIAHHGFKESGMYDEAIESGLHWIDLGLENVSDNAETMEYAISHAAPRSIGEKIRSAEICTIDLQYMLEWLMEQGYRDETGLLAEANQILQS